MHELSIAQSILDIIREHVPDERSVTSIRLRIGEMSGVVPDSLEFCFTAITQETPLAGARLEIDHIPFVLFCNSCRKELRSEPGIALCAACGSYDTRTVSGTELQVVEIELEDTT
jgi:hydrogenase nickel incorporation protein HypA/HybF